MFRRLLLATCACAAFVSFSVACGDDDDDDATAPSASAASPSARVSDPVSPSAVASPNTSGSPTVQGPASRYTLLLTDVGTGYFTDRSHTFLLKAEDYAGTPAFPSPSEGRKLLKEWGYQGGFETGYEPEGRQTDVLNGKYYVTVETHLFDAPAGAEKAFLYFENVLRAARRAEPVQAAIVGNQSSAWKLSDARIQGSSINGVFHRLILRRGSMVSIVQTWGAESFMRVDAVRGLASIIDQKATGQMEAVEPTPTQGP